MSSVPHMLPFLAITGAAGFLLGVMVMRRRARKNARMIRRGMGAREDRRRR
jgi:hypothetical protein